MAEAITAADKSGSLPALNRDTTVSGPDMVANTANQRSLLSASKLIADASACTHARYDSSTASKKIAQMEKLTVNTKTRVLAYEKFSAAISGTSFVLPQGDGCS